MGGGVVEEEAKAQEKRKEASNIGDKANDKHVVDALVKLPRVMENPKNNPFQMSTQVPQTLTITVFVLL